MPRIGGMETFWIVLSGKPRCCNGLINGEWAEIELPLGGVKRIKWPNWYPSEQTALDAIEDRRKKRLAAARKLLEQEKA